MTPYGALTTVAPIITAFTQAIQSTTATGVPSKNRQTLKTQSFKLPTPIYPSMYLPDMGGSRLSQILYQTPDTLSLDGNPVAAIKKNNLDIHYAITNYVFVR